MFTIVSASKYDCSFENDTNKLCGWFVQSTDGILWIRTKTLSAHGIVPMHDHSLGSGKVLLFILYSQHIDTFNHNFFLSNLLNPVHVSPTS